MTGPHSYGYILLLAATAASAVRLSRNFRSAEIQSLRLAQPEARFTQKILALVVLGGASALTALAFLNMHWLWIAAAVAWLSGLQSILVLVLSAPQQILILERVFGVLFAGVTVVVYLMFVR